MTPMEIVAFGLATGSGLALLWVVIHNWQVLVAGVRRPGSPRPALVFLAGPILVILLVQGLRFSAAPLSGRALAVMALVGLAIDPAALPAVLFVVARWFRRRSDRRE